MDQGKWKKYMVISLIVGFGIVLFAFGLDRWLKAPLKPYLAKHYSEIRIEDGKAIEGLELISKDASQYEVFLSGESHATEKNSELMLALLIYLHETQGVKYLLSEGGYAAEAYMNEYLQTGNEEILNEIFEGLKGTYGDNQDSYQFWKDLRAYNNTLPSKEKIQLVGIDIEHQIDTALIYLKKLLPTTLPNEDIETMIEKIKDMDPNQVVDSVVKTEFEAIQKDIREKQSLYEAYLGNDFFSFSLIVDNILNGIYSYEDHEKNFTTIREQSIYDNFKKVYSHYQEGKYFGQWGMWHVYQSGGNPNTNADKRFGMYLNDYDSPVKGKVASIAYYYMDCTQMVRGGGEEKLHSGFRQGDLLEGYGNGDMTLFQLDGENSPFKEKVFFVRNPGKGVTTDYFQYIMLIKNSKASSRYSQGD